MHCRCLKWDVFNWRAICSLVGGCRARFAVFAGYAIEEQPARADGEFLAFIVALDFRVANIQFRRRLGVLHVGVDDCLFEPFKGTMKLKSVATTEIAKLPDGDEAVVGTFVEVFHAVPEAADLAVNDFIVLGQFVSLVVLESLQPVFNQ